MKSFGYIRNDDWLSISVPNIEGDAIQIEGADDRASTRISFSAFVEVEKFKKTNAIDALEIQVIAKSRYGMVYEVCSTEELKEPQTELVVDISQFRSLPDLTIEVLVVANLGESESEFQPGRPVFDKSILGAKQVELSNSGVGSQYPNIQVKDFTKGLENSIWLVEIDWALLTTSTAEELAMLDISRAIALQINSDLVEHYRASVQLQIVSFFELARRSIESFFALQTSDQALVLAQLARRGSLENSWFQWLRWCFRSAFGTPFLEANKTNLGLVLLRWSVERDKVEAQLRSNIGRTLK